ncbi:MAG: hypothetical protein KDD32_06065 [Bacteroidetes bacterium]|nr:hypothetical protein [Bacteroidota bacterium]
MRSMLILLLLIAFDCFVHAQSVQPESKLQPSLGLEIQGYPTDVISSARTELLFYNANALNMSAGYNWFNHRDLGKHQAEKGGGFGSSLGYRRYFENEGLKGFFVGVKSDVWINKVHWKDFKGDGSLLISGTSKITVWQPTLSAGYRVKFANDLLSFEPNIAFGYEWNVRTTGNITYADPAILITDEVFKTGDGLIFLFGFSFMATFRNK